MGVTNNYTKLLLSGAILLSIFSSCQKEEQQPVKEVEISLPAAISLTYGEEQDITIPDELLNQSFSFAFDENENTEGKLYDKLAKAITVDKAQGKIHVNSKLIYPNGMVSSITGQKLPDSYKVTVMAGTGKTTVAVTVTPAKFEIKGLDNKAEIPYTYVLYGNTGPSFELEAGALLSENNTWYLDSKDASLEGNKIQFKASAGDPDKKTEKTYDLVASLKKDGFDVASRQFRVIFIPQIKFFYGTYYPEYDLTILLNQVYIALSNAYVSSAPTLYPENYKSAFSITAIEKDGTAFENKDGIFELNDKTGVITVKKNTILTEGSYKLTVKAITTTGLEFSATMTLNMSKLEE